MRVLVFSDVAIDGIAFNGSVSLDSAADREPEAAGTTALREIRAQGIEVRDGDLVVFPHAAPGQRFAWVDGKHIRRART